MRGTNARSRNRPLEEALEGIPPDRLKPEHKKLFAKWAKDVDDLGLIDTDSQEIYVDETKLRKFLREGLFPPEFEDRCVRKLSELPGSKLVRKRNGDKMRSVRWQELANRAGLFDEEPPEPQYKGPLIKASDMAEVRRVVKQRFPSMPDGMLDPETLSARIREVVATPADAPTQAESTADATVEVDLGAVWNCIVRRLGWWAAFGLVVLLGAIIVALNVASAGAAAPVSPWVAFWICLGFGLSVNTAALVGNCLINPYG